MQNLETLALKNTANKGLSQISVVYYVYFRKFGTNEIFTIILLKIDLILQYFFLKSVHNLSNVCCLLTLQGAS